MPERVVTVPASPTASPISRPFSIISMTGFRRATRKDSMRPTTNGDGGSDPLRNLSVMRTHPTSTLFRKSSPSVSASSPATASGNSPVMISVLPPPMSKTSTVPAPPGTRPSRSDTAPRKLMRPSSSPDRIRGRLESISSALSRNFCPFLLARRTLVAAAVIPSGFSGRIASTKPAMATSVRSTAAERSWCDSSTPSPSRVMTMRRSTVSVRAPSQSATRSLVELVPRSRDASRRWSFTPVPALSLELPLAPLADDARLLVPGLNALAGLNRQPVRQVRVKAFYRARAPARHAPAGHPRGDGLPRDRAGQFHLKRFELSLVLLEPRSRLGLFFETPGDGPRPRGALDRPELLCGVRATEPEERGRRAAAAFERKGQDHGGHAVRAAARHENTSLRQLAHLARDDFHVGGFRQLQPGERGPYSRRDHVKRAEGVFRPQGVRHYRRGSDCTGRVPRAGAAGTRRRGNHHEPDGQAAAGTYSRDVPLPSRHARRDPDPSVRKPRRPCGSLPLALLPARRKEARDDRELRGGEVHRRASQRRARAGCEVRAGRATVRSASGGTGPRGRGGGRRLAGGRQGRGGREPGRDKMPSRAPGVQAVCSTPRGR